jgi:glycosyltransferase involved in cell wall biosynthesis
VDDLSAYAATPVWTNLAMKYMPERSKRLRPNVEPSRPRLGVLATHAIQYQTPLYQELSRRAVVDLEVAFLSQRGARPYRDPGFGVMVAWDIDLLSGYQWILLEHKSRGDKIRWPFALGSWLRRQDIVVLHGHANPEMLFAAAVCRILSVPYLLRGESHPGTTTTGWRRLARHALAWFTVNGAVGALPIGKLNAAFYDHYGRLPHFRAPYSVDNGRFRAASDAARSMRTERLTSLGLDPRLPTAIFSGKLTPRKRPLDPIRAIAHCEGQLNLLMLGDGPLRSEVRHFEAQLPVRCLGFVNQADLPGWYATGDVLVLPSQRETWGLVVNEAMACGLVPVVSDAVGCAPDLVDGIGEIFPVGDIEELANALIRATQDTSARSQKIRRRLEHYTLIETAHGYEQAALALNRHNGRSGQSSDASPR